MQVQDLAQTIFKPIAIISRSETRLFPRTPNHHQKVQVISIKVTIDKPIGTKQ